MSIQAGGKHPGKAMCGHGKATVSQSIALQHQLDWSGVSTDISAYAAVRTQTRQSAIDLPMQDH